MKDNNLFPKILLVDDKPENLVVLEKLLKSLQVTTYKTTSGNEALSMMLEHDFALALLDVQMPEMDGYELLETMLLDERTAHIPVIFITANYRDEAHKIKGYKYGAVDYLYKPIQEDLLLGKIKVFIDLYEEKTKHRKAEEQFQSILNAASEGILGLDWNGNIHFANPIAEKLLHYPRNSLVTLNFNQLLKSDNMNGNSWDNKLIYDTCQKGLVYHSEDTYFVCADGKSFPVEYTATPLSSNTQDGLVIVFSDVTVRKAFEEQLMSLAMYDHLTKLPNRLFFEKILSQSIARNLRNKSLMAVLFLDLDKFKLVNDTLGHDMGDALLKAFANRLRSCVRQSDTIARLGGDEFAIILDPIARQEDAAPTAEKIITAAQKPYQFGETEVLNSTSIGIAVFPTSGTSAATLVKNADIAMYKAKQSGRNSYHYFTDSMHEQSRRKETLMQELRTAIKQEAIALHYQPALSIKTNKIEYVEALVRWENSKYGAISPLEIVNLAEETGLIFDLGKLLLTKTLQEAKNWYQKNIFSGRIVFNISSNQLLQHDLLDLFTEISKEFSFPLESLAIDITEESLLHNSPSSLSMIQAMHEAGMQVNLNNFGSGFSSLNLLRQLPLSILKIDRTFMKATVENENEIHIIHALITLAHSLSFSAMAEGIESVEQAKILTEHGCDYLQGYYFSPPLPSEPLMHFLRNHL